MLKQVNMCTASATVLLKNCRWILHIIAAPLLHPPTELACAVRTLAALVQCINFLCCCISAVAYLLLQFREVFLSPHHINIVMDYASGGSLFGYVQSRNRLREPLAR
jgi:hypothetical protein